MTLQQPCNARSTNAHNLKDLTCQSVSFTQAEWGRVLIAAEACGKAAPDFIIGVLNETLATHPTSKHKADRIPADAKYRFDIIGGSIQSFSLFLPAKPYDALDLIAVDIHSGAQRLIHKIVCEKSAA